MQSTAPTASTGSTESTESTTPTESTESTTPTEATTDGNVPDVTGMRAAEAKVALRDAGYKTYVNSGRFQLNEGTATESVCVQRPKAGSAAESGTQVTIVVRDSCKAYGG